MPLLRPLPRDKLEREIFGLRMMRHVFRVKANLTIGEWRLLMAVGGQFGRSHQWLLTRDEDLEVGA